MREIRGAMFLLLGAMALVLLIACANLSSLALARSATRHRDMAICLALGAGRWGLARQQLAEVVWLALVGGGLGLLVAYVGLPALVSLVPPIANTLGLTPTIGWRGCCGPARSPWARRSSWRCCRSIRPRAPPRTTR